MFVGTGTYLEVPTLQTPCGANLGFRARSSGKMTLPPVWSHRPKTSVWPWPWCIPGPRTQSGHTCSASETALPSPYFSPVSFLSSPFLPLMLYLPWRHLNLVTPSLQNLSWLPTVWEKQTQLLSRTCKTTTACHQTPCFHRNSLFSLSQCSGCCKTASCTFPFPPTSHSVTMNLYPLCWTNSKSTPWPKGNLTISWSSRVLTWDLASVWCLGHFS